MDSTCIQIQDMVRNTRERLEADFSKLKTKIHEFPPGLRSGIDERYIIPSFVSLGPYHHDKKNPRKTEELKHAAAHYLCGKSGHTVEKVYGKIFSIVGEDRSCYADDVVVDFNDDEFTVMMFLDGCYLLHYMAMDTNCALLVNRMTLSTGPCMLRDIFLLENQLPWLVLEALMGFMKEPPVYGFVTSMAESFNVTPNSSTRVSVGELKKYRPPHLLGLLQYYLVGSMPCEYHLGYTLSLASSAIELEEIGIKLTASNTTWFADMSIQKDRIFGGQLSLTPLFVNDFTACWLANMAAYEACMSTTYPSDGFAISSYISLLAMLMDKEEDVHELRAKHLVRSFLSNHELLVFFKGLALQLRLGNRYFIITHEIEMYKREKPVSIVGYRFAYNNIRLIAALLSIASVLAGIFRILTNLKQHQQ